ncbi:MAG TPA: MFS transporter, partial [Treponemataceae bacterium]|nr:MFS transporter [Treponemataceae bacterium]
MAEQLSPFKIKRGRRVFDSYSAINSFSFALVTGNTVTLYALALGASSTVVGLLSAFMFLSFYAIPLGKLGLRRWSLVRTFANNWMVRNWSLVPLLAIPYL